MTTTREEAVERALATLLDALAVPLIALNITPGRLGQIAKTSFVRAGAAQARKISSGRPHLARIAALTGLTRAEVKRIVSANFSVGHSEPESWPRALRVLAAWKSSKLNVSGAPLRRLKIHGRRDSFAALCRSHSGDIPPRVILTELEKTGKVKINARRTHVSLAPSMSPPTKPNSAESSLEFAAAFLDFALRSNTLLVKRRQRVQVSPAIPVAYLEDAIAGRVNELLDQLPGLFPTKKRGSREEVNVFALVVRDQKQGEKRK
jgi:hypothetical protein